MSSLAFLFDFPRLIDKESIQIPDEKNDIFCVFVVAYGIGKCFYNYVYLRVVLDYLWFIP